MNWLDVLATASFALRGNWMRSALTSLGVIIGIAAVIVMVSIGQGTQAQIDRQLAGLGAQKLDIGPGSSRSPTGVRLAASSYLTLNEGDIAAIAQEIPEVQYISGSVRGSSQVVYAEKNWNSSWRGVEEHFLAINGWTVANGSGFEAQHFYGAERVVLIGETIRRELFGEENGIGAEVRIGRTMFTVIGTLGSKGLSGFGSDQDEILMVPLDTARRRLMSTSGLPSGAVMDISLTVAKADDLPYVQAEVESLLRQRHNIGPSGAQRGATGRHAQPDHPAHVLASGRGGDDFVDRRRHRHHEHHAGFRHRARGRDWIAHGGRCRTGRYPPPVLDGSDAAVAGWRVDWHPDRDCWRTVGRALQQRASD